VKTDAINLPRLERSTLDLEASEVIQGMYDASLGLPHQHQNDSRTRGYSMQRQWEEIKTKQSEQWN